MIAEDDNAFSKMLVEYLQRFEQETSQPMEITVFQDGAELIEHYHGNADLLLLDVEMPGMDGLTAAKEIRKNDPKVLIIFITNLAQYAIHGYEVKALDYVLKPIRYYDLAMKLSLALRIIRRNEEHSILLNRDGGFVRVPLSHLYYIDVYGHRFCYHTAEENITVTLSRTMSSVEEELSPYGFIRCHNGYLINLRYVDSIEGTYILLNGEKIPVSRNRRRGVLQGLLHYMKGGGAE